jgi:hypothetical protein
VRNRQSVFQVCGTSRKKKGGGNETGVERNSNEARQDDTRALLLGLPFREMWREEPKRKSGETEDALHLKAKGPPD